MSTAVLRSQTHCWCACAGVVFKGAPSSCKTWGRCDLLVSLDQVQGLFIPDLDPGVCSNYTMQICPQLCEYGHCGVASIALVFISRRTPTSVTPTGGAAGRGGGGAGGQLFIQSFIHFLILLQMSSFFHLSVPLCI